MAKPSPLPPPNRRRAFIVNLAGGWLGNSVLIVQGILFIPLYINELGSELYGFWLATGGILAWFAMVDVGAASVTQQRCAAAYAKNDFQGVVDYLWHGLVVMLLVGAVYTGLILLSYSHVSSWFNIPEQHEQVLSGCFLLAAAGTYSYLFSLVFRAFCTGLQRNEVHSVANLLGSLSAIAVIYIALVHLDWGLWSIPAANFFRQTFELSVNVIYSASLLRRINHQTNWQKSTFRDYRKNTTALLAAKASSNFATSLPNILITRMIGPEATVIYNVTTRPIQIVSAFINRANSSMFSAFSHYCADPRISDERFAKLGQKTALIFGTVPTGAVLLYCFLNEPFINIWVGPEQFAGQLFTALTAVASFLLFSNNFFNGLVSATGEISKANWLMTGESLLKAAVLLPAIYFFELIGAQVAMIVAAVLFQYRYYRILRVKKAYFAKPLRPLLFFWIFILAAVLTAYSLFN